MSRPAWNLDGASRRRDGDGADRGRRSPVSLKRRLVSAVLGLRPGALDAHAPSPSVISPSLFAGP